ncbi:MAG TPA: ATP-binding protein [Candidatus Limnocylindria bacterium]
MRVPPRTLAGRIVAASVVGFLAGLLFLAVVAPLIAQEHDGDALRDRLASEAGIVAELSRDGLRAEDADALDALAHRLASSAGVRITIIGRTGVVLGESDEDRRTMENHSSRPEVAAALAGDTGSVIRRSATVGLDLVYVAVPVRDGATIVGVARTALPLSTLRSLTAPLVGLIVASGLGALLIVVVVLAILVRQVTRPIARLTAGAERLARGDAASFAVGGPDEVARLGGALRRMSSVIIGERERAELERDRLAVLIDELADAVVIASADGRILRANRAAARRLGVPEPVGRRLVEVVRDHEVIEAIGAARADADEVGQLERAEPARFERIITRLLAGGELLLVIQDLTNLRRLETVRRDFVANVSHELRTPLASLKAIAETLGAGAIDDRDAARDFVRRMEIEIGDLARLVEELLTLGRFEAGDAAIRREPVAPAELLRHAQDRMAALAARAGIDLLVTAADLPTVLADRERIDQVFANLIHNATKHTPAGGTIRLSAATRDRSVAFSVADTGEGIALHERERIFERFYKTDRSRGGGGSGLGLAIVKHIVQAHGGEIRVDSDGPRGATFTFTLPTV